MSYDFTLSAVIPASPRAIYDAWLDSRGHGAMTGSAARMSAKPGAAPQETARATSWPLT